MKFIIDNNSPHLGGNLDEIDPGCWSPMSWKYIIEKFNIKSVMDLGSGAGYAAKWFAEHGLEVTAVEGLEENVKKSRYPAMLHDLTSGSFFKEVDLVNCIEVVEHIEEEFLDNLLTTLCQGNYIFMTHAVPGQAGWHHVNCRESNYWISHLEKRNFNLLDEDSKIVRDLAKKEGAFHIARNGMIFKKKI
jgi:SAM-dependent methyltransferase